MTAGTGLYTYDLGGQQDDRWRAGRGGGREEEKEEEEDEKERKRRRGGGGQPDSKSRDVLLVMTVNTAEQPLTA